MFVYGYRKSTFRSFICYLCIGLTLGLLRLVMHWWSHWLLLATHKPCSLEQAEKVLVKEQFQGKHAIYYVKKVTTLTADSIRYVHMMQSRIFKGNSILFAILKSSFPFISHVCSDSIKNAELTECFSERFTPNDADIDLNRQLEIHLSDGKFQRKHFS